MGTKRQYKKFGTISFTYKTVPKWGAFYLFIANCFATQIIGGAKELVVLL